MRTSRSARARASSPRSEVDRRRACPNRCRCSSRRPTTSAPTMLQAVIAKEGEHGIDGLFEAPADDRCLVPHSRLLCWSTACIQGRRSAGLSPRGEKRSGKPDVFGAFALYQVLASRLDPSAVLTAADAWGGDSMVTFTGRAPPASGGAVRGQDPRRAPTCIGDVLWRQWAAEMPAGVAKVDSDADGATLTAHDPGVSATEAPNRALTALVFAGNRGAPFSEVVKQGLPVNVASCAADGVVRVPLFGLLGDRGRHQPPYRVARRGRHRRGPEAGAGDPPELRCRERFHVAARTEPGKLVERGLLVDLRRGRIKTIACGRFPRGRRSSEPPPAPPLSVREVASVATSAFVPAQLRDSVRLRGEPVRSDDRVFRVPCSCWIGSRWSRPRQAAVPSARRLLPRPALVSHEHPDLRAVGERLERTVRPDDTVACDGAGHFVVVCHNLDHDGQAERVTQRLLDVIAVPCLVGRGARASTRRRRRPHRARHGPGDAQSELQLVLGTGSDDEVLGLGVGDDDRRRALLRLELELLGELARRCGASSSRSSSLAWSSRRTGRIAPRVAGTAGPLSGTGRASVGPSSLAKPHSSRIRRCQSSARASVISTDSPCREQVLLVAVGREQLPLASDARPRPPSPRGTRRSPVAALGAAGRSRLMRGDDRFAGAGIRTAGVRCDDRRRSTRWCCSRRH